MRNGVIGDFCSAARKMGAYAPTVLSFLPARSSVLIEAMRAAGAWQHAAARQFFFISSREPSRD